MTGEEARAVLAALYTAAGRRAGEAEEVVWERALASAPSEGYSEVVDLLLRTNDLGAPGRGAPTPALFLAARREWLRSATVEQPALPAPMAPDGRAQVARLRRLLAETQVTRPAPRVEPEEVRPPPRWPLTRCAEEDHRCCGDGPIGARPKTS